MTRRQRSLTLSLPVQREAYNAHFTFFHGKLPHFAVYFIQNNTKLTPPQNLGDYAQMP